MLDNALDAGETKVNSGGEAKTDGGIVQSM